MVKLGDGPGQSFRTKLDAQFSFADGSNPDGFSAFRGEHMDGSVGIFGRDRDENARLSLMKVSHHRFRLRSCRRKVNAGAKEVVRIETAFR